jgi:hypothetical protein
MRQCCCWCDSAVDVMQQHCWSCDSAVVDVTALLIMRQFCGWCNGAVHMMWQCHGWRRAAVDMMWQHCWSCISAVVDATVLPTSCNSTVDHATVPSLMWRHCWCDARALSIMLSHDWQRCHVIGSTVTCTTAMLCNWQQSCSMDSVLP